MYFKSKDMHSFIWDFLLILKYYKSMKEFEKERNRGDQNKSNA